MKIEQSTVLKAGVHTQRRKGGHRPPGTAKGGIRLDDLLDILITMRAAGVPDHANVDVTSGFSDYRDTVCASWTEERG